MESLKNKIEANHPCTTNNAVKKIWIWLYLLDFLIYFIGDNIFFILKYFFSGNKNKFIWILDRYYFDGLIDISCAFKDDSIITSGYLYKIFQFILPKPMITILLDITPEITKIRKPEEQLNYEYIDLRRTKYLRLAKLIGINVVDATSSFSSVTKSLLKLIRKELPKLYI